MQPHSRQDLVKPHIAELRQQARNARMAQAARRARHPRIEHHWRRAPSRTARVIAQRVLAVLGVNS